jgi:hypothetical protein
MSEVMSVYCKAYQLKQLQAFEGWPTGTDAADGESVVFVHDDFSVTEGVVPRAKVLFAGGDEAWRSFCRQQLAFEIPADVTRAMEFAAAEAAGAP